MKIQSINSASAAYMGNSIQFAGKHKKQAESRNLVRQSLMAVPLATLIAMSPMNVTAAERNSVFGDDAAKVENVESALVDKESSISMVKAKDGSGVMVIVKENGETYTLDLRSKNKDGNIQKIRLLVASENDDWQERKLEAKLTGKGPVELRLHDLEALQPVKFTIMGDDGFDKFKVNLDQLYIKGSKLGYSSEKLVDFIKDFVAGKVDGLKNDGAIKVNEPIRRVLGVGYGGQLVNGAHSTTWMDDGRKESEAWGRTILSTDVNTMSGKYTLFAISTDENSEDFESVVIRKEGEGEFKVAGIKFVNINLSDRAKMGSFQMGVTELYKRFSTEKVRLVDPDLYSILAEVTNDTRFNNAYKSENVNCDMSLLGYGVVAKRDGL